MNSTVKKKSTNTVVWLVLAIPLLCIGGCGALFVGASVSQTAKTTTAETPKSAAPSTVEPAPTATLPPVVPIGSEVSPAKGWTVRVDAPITDVTDAIKAGNRSNSDPKPGKRFFGVTVSITNRTDEPNSPMFQMDLQALPPTGAAVDSKSFIAGFETLDMDRLQPGRTVAGVIVFELDPSAISGTVLLAEPTFTLDRKKDQQFLAVQ